MQILMPDNMPGILALVLSINSQGKRKQPCFTYEVMDTQKVSLVFDSLNRKFNSQN